MSLLAHFLQKIVEQLTSEVQVSDQWRMGDCQSSCVEGFVAIKRRLAVVRTTLGADKIN
jgi:hypothetical protein